MNSTEYYLINGKHGVRCCPVSFVGHCHLEEEREIMWPSCDCHMILNYIKGFVFRLTWCRKNSAWDTHTQVLQEMETWLMVMWPVMWLTAAGINVLQLSSTSSLKWWSWKQSLFNWPVETKVKPIGAPFFNFFFIDVGTCPAFVHASIRTSFMWNYFVHLASSSQECTAFLYIPRISSRPVSLSLLAKRARALITTSSCPWEMKQYPHLIHFPFRITYACNTDM